MFTGCGTALVTPFRRDLSLDEDAVARLVRRQIDGGINFLRPVRHDRRKSHAVSCRAAPRGGNHRRGSARQGSLPGGAGGNDTAHVIELAREFKELGANGILSSARTTTSPPREGGGLVSALQSDCRCGAAADHLYNIPGRTGVNIEPATLKRLAEIDNIIGVKEASGNIHRWPPFSTCGAGEVFSVLRR